jgi:hypothetical protein
LLIPNTTESHVATCTSDELGHCSNGKVLSQMLFFHKFWCQYVQLWWDYPALPWNRLLHSQHLVLQIKYSHAMHYNYSWLRYHVQLSVSRINYILDTCYERIIKIIVRVYNQKIILIVIKTELWA